jgi:hypothetical protein
MLREPNALNRQPCTHPRLGGSDPFPPPCCRRQRAGANFLEPPQREVRRILLPRLSGRWWAGMMVAYSPGHGKQQIPYGSVRRRMALHRPASSRAHEAGTSHTPRFTSDLRRRLLRPKERPLLAATAEGFTTLEDRLRLVQAVAHRRDLGAPENAELRERPRARLGRDPNPSAGIAGSQ